MLFSSLFDPVPVFSHYLFLHDHFFPAATLLWLTSCPHGPSFYLVFIFTSQKFLVVPPYSLGVPLILRSSKLPNTSFVPLVGGCLMPGSFIFVFTPLCYMLYYTAASLHFRFFSFLIPPLIACQSYDPVSSQKKKRFF